MKKFYKGEFLLSITAFIWGTAFVAQKASMQHLGAFTFNGLRFFLGFLCLLAFYRISKKQRALFKKENLLAGLVLGIILFLAASSQQIGIIYTTSGKAGFITGLYVIIVPFIGFFLKHKIDTKIWIGSFLALVGLYMLSITKDLTINYGDFLVLISAFFFALHIVTISHFLKKNDALELSLMQYLVCIILNFAASILTETTSISSISSSFFPIIYGGIFSVGIAYTLQTVAQKNVSPSSSAIILSFEAVFAVLAGYFILNEILSFRGKVGCFFMLTGIILTQIDVRKILKKNILRS